MQQFCHHIADCTGIRRRADGRTGQGNDTEDKNDMVGRQDTEDIEDTEDRKDTAEQKYTENIEDTEDREDTVDNLATGQEVESYKEKVAAGNTHHEDITVVNIE